MSKPDWVNFKNIWWVIITLAVSFFLYKRYDSLISDQSNAIDIFVFLIWVALLLYPLFSEMNFWGLSFKKEVEELKSEVTKNLAQLKSDIRSEIQLSNSNSISPVFNLPSSESSLSEIESSIKASLEQYLNERGLKAEELVNKELYVDDNASLMFRARLNIEKELRRIWEGRFTPNEDQHTRYIPIQQISGILVTQGVIDQRLHNMIREVYSIASPAIHGEDINKDQIEFVKDVTPDIVATLRTLK